MEFGKRGTQQKRGVQVQSGEGAESDSGLLRNEKGSDGLPGRSVQSESGRAPARFAQASSWASARTESHWSAYVSKTIEVLDNLSGIDCEEAPHFRHAVLSLNSAVRFGRVEDWHGVCGALTLAFNEMQIARSFVRLRRERSGVTDPRNLGPRENPVNQIMGHLQHSFDAMLRYLNHQGRQHLAEAQAELSGAIRGVINLEGRIAHKQVA